MRTDQASSLGVRAVAGSLFTLALLAVLTWLVVSQGAVDHILIAAAIAGLATIAVYVNVRATKSRSQGSGVQGSGVQRSGVQRSDHP